MNYETVIGLEIHIQLRTASKMFCGCDNYSVSAKPNTNVCPVCLGLPGTLPVPNKKAIEWIYLLGLALNGKISNRFNFERKNYFYPDLPKAYQITSSTNFPVEGGHLDVDLEGNIKKVDIHHIHLEEDAGKLIHDQGDYSLVDLNRAGTPLIELVTEPGIRSPEEARIFVQNLRSIVRYLGISDANMEQGNLRCDANISLRKKGDKELGSKVEIKNLNSFKMIQRALEYEQERQSDLLEENKKVIQETRGWDDAKGKTIPQRLKEEALDYRYFPDPDLPPVEAKDAFDLDKIKGEMPELPEEKQTRFKEEYGLNIATAELLVSDLEVASYFEKTIEQMPETALNSVVLKDRAKKAANWILSELFGRLNTASISISETKVKPEYLAKLIELIESNTISGKIGKEVFDEMFEGGKNPEHIIKEKGLEQVSDTEEIEKIIKKVISENSKVVDDYKSGKVQVLGFLVGQVMKETGGKANPKVVNELLAKRLK